MMAYPKKKWRQPQRAKRLKAECPEEELQIALDQYVEYCPDIVSHRLPDWAFRWLKRLQHVTVTVFTLDTQGRKIYPECMADFARGTMRNKMFRRIFDILGGRSDNTLMIKISNEYSLAFHPELKTQDSQGRPVGKLHGRQKIESQRLPWTILRSTDQIVKAIEKFRKDAEFFRKVTWNRFSEAKYSDVERMMPHE